MVISESDYIIFQWEKLVSVFGDPYGDYAMRLTRLSLQINDPEQAGQRYIKYEQSWWSRDESIMSQIKEMKSELK